MWFEEQALLSRIVQVAKFMGFRSGNKGGHTSFGQNPVMLLLHRSWTRLAMWAGVTSTGDKTYLIFIEEGVKVNQHVYLDLLKNKLVPWINATFGESGIVLQQDGATSHKANRVQEWCERNMTGFWPKKLWPPYLQIWTPWILRSEVF